MDLNIASKEYKLNKGFDVVLDALIYIQENIDKSLGFKYNCKSGVCGSCTVRVNGTEKLACMCKVNDKDTIEPLNNLPLIKDLIVDESNISNCLSAIDTTLDVSNNISQKDIEVIESESNCILCNACYSSCPVYEYNQDFIGPFALTRAYKFYNDAKENTSRKKLEPLQVNGIWDCTLCGNCSIVCPQSIDIKTDIQRLQNFSVQSAFENPLLNSFNGGFDPFGGFGFNPDNC